MKKKIRRALAVASLTLASLALTGNLVHAESSPQVLRVVPQVNLTVLDPIFSSAYVTRNHGYMIYDTLFGTDDKGNIKPEMVDRWNVSADHKTWTFTLRPGLAFHDGAPVTSDDVIASLKRWSSRDAIGGLLAQALDRYEAVDANTFRIHLKEPFGLVLEALGKPSSPVPFIMPARIAATPGTEQIKEYIGSGPYIFKPDEFKPGERVVYVKNDKYKPRKEPASGTAGGTVVNVDRVEWLIIRDANAQLNSLTVGEVDILEPPPAELYEPLRTVKDVKLFDMVPTEEALALQSEIIQISIQIQRLRDLSRALKNDRDQVLRIDCVPSIAATILPPTIERFSQQFPRVIFHLETHSQSNIMERLMRRQSDIGFSLASMPNPAVIEETIARGHGVCVAPIGTLSRSKTSVTWEDLKTCRLIQIPASGQFGGLMLEAAHSYTESTLGRITVTTNFLALKLAEQGLGVATIDSFTASTANRARVNVVPIAPEIPVEVKALHRFQGKLSHSATSFIKTLAAVAQASVITP